jgi:hypothetical protein
MVRHIVEEEEAAADVEQELGTCERKHICLLELVTWKSRLTSINEHIW